MTDGIDRRHRRLSVIAAALGLAWASGNPTVASAQGFSPADLVNAGWDCLDVGGAIHCFEPGSLEGLLTEEAEVVTALAFSNTDGHFLGVEQNIRADLFHGQPCPTDPPSRQYTDLLPIFGLHYFACHRYDSPF